MKNQVWRQIKTVILLSVLMVSCSIEEIITKQIREMQSSPVRVHSEEMVYLCEDGITSTLSHDKNTPFYLVIFSNSTGCSSCAVNRLSKWNEFLNFERENKLGLIFILNPAKVEYNDVVNAYSSSGIEHSVLIDTCGVFLEENPQIPRNRTFHTFLMDSNGNVLLVGNPIGNQKIRDLMYKIINDKASPKIY